MCDREREYVKIQAIEDRRVFASSSWLSISRNDACVMHMTRMWRVKTDGNSYVSQITHG